MDVTRERYQSAQEEKKQLTLKVEELERLEILGSLVLLTFPFHPPSIEIFFFRRWKHLQCFSSPPFASRILHAYLSHKDL